jgi:hypothetical protein
MAFDGTVLCKELGATAEPTTFKLQVAPREALDWLAGGALDPRQGRFKDGEPLPGGLFDETVFGPLNRDAAGKPVLKHYREIQPRDRPQAVRFGSLDLPCPVVHPWVLRLTTGSAGDLLRDLAFGERVFVGDEVVLNLPDNGDGVILFAGEAVARAAALQHLRIQDGALLTRIPVLPAGLRPLVQDGETRQIHDLTIQYENIQDKIRKIVRLRELNAPQIILLHQTVALQRAVCALFIDGLTEQEYEQGETYWEPTDPEGEEEPTVGSLRHFLAHNADWAAQIDNLAASNERPFSRTWHSPPYFFRAWLEASALEIAPLTPTGEVDALALTKSRVDRAARIFDRVYTQFLSPMWTTVLHDSGQEPPHTDVYATEPRADGTRLLITAGMSTERMLEEPRLGPCPNPYAELVMKIPADVEDSKLVDMMRVLLTLSRYPLRRKTFFAPRQDVYHGGPILPGSPMSAYLIASRVDAEPFTKISYALPRSPVFLLVVAIGEAEMAALKGGPRAQRVAEILQATGGVSRV